MISAFNIDKLVSSIIQSKSQSTKIPTDDFTKVLEDTSSIFRAILEANPNLREKILDGEIDLEEFEEQIKESLEKLSKKKEMKNDNTIKNLPSNNQTIDFEKVKQEIQQVGEKNIQKVKTESGDNLIASSEKFIALQEPTSKSQSEDQKNLYIPDLKDPKVIQNVNGSENDKLEGVFPKQEKSLDSLKISKTYETENSSIKNNTEVIREELENLNVEFKDNTNGLYKELLRLEREEQKNVLKTDSPNNEKALSNSQIPQENNIQSSKEILRTDETLPGFSNRDGSIIINQRNDFEPTERKEQEKVIEKESLVRNNSEIGAKENKSASEQSSEVNNINEMKKDFSINGDKNGNIVQNLRMTKPEDTKNLPIDALGNRLNEKDKTQTLTRFEKKLEVKDEIQEDSLRETLVEKAKNSKHSPEKLEKREFEPTSEEKLKEVKNEFPKKTVKEVVEENKPKIVEKKETKTDQPNELKSFIEKKEFEPTSEEKLKEVENEFPKKPFKEVVEEHKTDLSKQRQHTQNVEKRNSELSGSFNMDTEQRTYEIKNEFSNGTFKESFYQADEKTEEKPFKPVRSNETNMDKGISNDRPLEKSVKDLQNQTKNVVQSQDSKIEEIRENLVSEPFKIQQKDNEGFQIKEQMDTEKNVKTSSEIEKETEKVKTDSTDSKEVSSISSDKVEILRQLIQMKIDEFFDSEKRENPSEQKVQSIEQNIRNISYEGSKNVKSSENRQSNEEFSEQFRNNQPQNENKLNVKEFKVEVNTLNKKLDLISKEIIQEKPKISESFKQRLVENLYSGGVIKKEFIGSDELKVSTNNNFNNVERYVSSRNIEEIYEKVRAFSLSNSIEEKATLKLYPKELGEIEVHMRKVGKQIEIFFTAEFEETRKTLEKNSSLLTERFTKLDFEVRNMEFKTKESAEEQKSRDSNQQFSQNQRENENNKRKWKWVMEDDDGRRES